MLKSFLKTPEIEFLCEENDWGVIPEPFPARKLIPDWFKALPPRTTKGLGSGTVKRCPPFLDAMQLGWILPLAADVEFHTNETGSKLEHKTMFYKAMVEAHGYNQVTTDKAPHPSMPRPPMKFLNHWAIKVPKGYSVLFVPPLNRPDPRFQCMSGMVDCDGYEEFVNFPFTFNEKNFHGIIEAGTPLVQVIPIKRDTLFKEAKIRKETKADANKRALVRRQRASHESLYRDRIWERK
jgi:hypothetical protein